MPVLGLMNVVLEVPNLQVGTKFYTDAGLDMSVCGTRGEFRCLGQNNACIELIGGAVAKRLYHLTLRGERLDELKDAVVAHGGTLVEAPEGFSDEGLWLLDPNGMRLHIVEADIEQALVVEPAFVINGPGRIVRIRQSAILPQKAYPPVRPRRLGHALLFTPSLDRSISFCTQALGMGLADRAQHVIAFLCCKKNGHL